MTAPRLVLDTNVLLPTLLFPTGSVSWLRSTWQSETICPLASHDTTMEMIRVLSYPKFQLTVGEQEDLIADYLSWCETITVTHPPTVPSCRDPSVRPFLELALQGRADALVTGDEDLLALSSVFTVPILTPYATRIRMGKG